MMSDDEGWVEEIRGRAARPRSQRDVGYLLVDDIPWLLDRLRAAEAERDARAEDARLYNEDVSRAISERNAAEARSAEAEAVIAEIRAHPYKPPQTYGLPIWLQDLLAEAPSAVLARVKAEVWDEGVKAALRWEGYSVPDHAAVLEANPYRAGADHD